MPVIDNDGIIGNGPVLVHATKQTNSLELARKLMVAVFNDVVFHSNVSDNASCRAPFLISRPGLKSVIVMTVGDINACVDRVSGINGVVAEAANAVAAKKLDAIALYPRALCR